MSSVLEVVVVVGIASFNLDSTVYLHLDVKNGVSVNGVLRFPSFF